MKDMHKELLERSVKDAVGVTKNLNEEEGVDFGMDFVQKAALQLYQHRTKDHFMRREQAEHESSLPDYPEDDMRGTR